MEVLKELDGAYGLLIKSSHYPGELVAAKKGSPLIIGIKDRHVQQVNGQFTSGQQHGGTHGGRQFECFLASDASAVIEHTKRYVLVGGGC